MRVLSIPGCSVTVMVVLTALTSSLLPLFPPSSPLPCTDIDLEVASLLINVFKPELIFSALVSTLLRAVVTLLVEPLLEYWHLVSLSFFDVVEFEIVFTEDFVLLFVFFDCVAFVVLMSGDENITSLYEHMFLDVIAHMGHIYLEGYSDKKF